MPVLAGPPDVAPTPPEVRPAPRLHYIDGLRGMAMLMVLLFHGWVRNHYWHLNVPLGPHHYVNIASLLSHGYTGVHLFLVLSGFCLFWPFVKGGTRAEPTLWQFARKRCRRILPPYYVVLALFGGIALVQSLTSIAPAHKTGYVLDWLWMHGTMMHNLFPGYVMTINAPLWTLALEFQLYILFPLFVEAYRRFNSHVVLLTVFTFTIIVHYLANHAAAPGDLFAENVLTLTNSVFGRCFEFALGMFAAKRVAQWHRDGGRLVHLADGGIVAAFVLVTAIDHRFWHLGTTSDAMWGLIYASLLLAGSHPGLPIHRLLSARWLVACGIFSYSVYLIHEPLMIALHQYVVPQPLSNAGNAALELCVVVPLMLGLGYLFHLLFECPFMNAPRDGGRFLQASYYRFRWLSLRRDAADPVPLPGPRAVVPDGSTPASESVGSLP